jgi:hypothetical protein
MLVATNAVLTADDLTVELGGLPVLRGVSLSVRTGEAVAPDGRQWFRKIDPGPYAARTTPPPAWGRPTVRLALARLPGLVSRWLCSTTFGGVVRRLEGQGSGRGRTLGA